MSNGDSDAAGGGLSRRDALRAASRVAPAVPLLAPALAVAAPRASPSALPRTGESPINVKSFGARGDSDDRGLAGTDDTEAITAALDHLGQIGGGSLYFPEGSYRVSSYLTVPNFTSLKGAGRRASKIVGTHAGGGGATAAESVRNGTILYNAAPINKTTPVHVTIESLWLHNAHSLNQGAGFYQQSGGTVLVRDCELTGSKWGIIFDQTEDATIEFCEPSSYVAGGAGIWLVNGSDLDPTAKRQFTNAISIRDCHVNVRSGSYGLLDDGGCAHLVSGGDFNGGINAIRAANVAGLTIIGIYAESQSSETISLHSKSASGTTVGGSITLIEGGQFSGPSVAIRGTGSPGSLTVIGGSYGGTAIPLRGTSSFANVVIINPGLAGYPRMPFCDGTAGGTHLDLGNLARRG